MIFSVKRRERLPLEINLPTSKSYTNRLIIRAIANKQNIQLRDVTFCDDVEYTLKALSEIGFEIKKTNTIIETFFPNKNAETVSSSSQIDLGEGGTTARFIIALAATLNREYIFRLDPQLAQRPWDEYLELLRSLQVRVEKNENIIKIKGPIVWPQVLEVDCSRTTQFASALMLVCPKTTKITPVNVVSSQKYIELTEQIIKMLENHSVIQIPKDWSAAAFPMVFAALTGDIYFPGLAYDIFQADAFMFDILKKRGCLSETELGLTVHAIKRRDPLDIDISQCLDLCFPLFIMAAHLTGQSSFKGAKNLKYKETDRLKEMENLAREFKVKMQIGVGENDYQVTGTSTKASPLQLDLKKDHRLVMAATLMLAYHNGGTMTNSEAVKKSWPSFFKDLYF